MGRSRCGSPDGSVRWGGSGCGQTTVVVGVRSVVFGDQQAQVRGEVGTARCGGVAEQALAAGGAAALFVRSVFVEHCLQCADDARQLGLRDPRRGDGVGGLPSTGEIGQVAVQ